MLDGQSSSSQVNESNEANDKRRYSLWSPFTGLINKLGLSSEFVNNSPGQSSEFVNNAKRLAYKQEQEDEQEQEQ